MRRTLRRCKILLPWFFGIGVASGSAILIMYGVLLLYYGYGSDYAQVFRAANKFAIGMAIYTFLFAFMPLFFVEKYDTARERASWLRDNVATGRLLMRYAHPVGLLFLLWYEVIMPFGAMTSLAIENLDPEDTE